MIGYGKDRNKATHHFSLSNHTPTAYAQVTRNKQPRTTCRIDDGFEMSGRILSFPKPAPLQKLTVV